MLRLETLRKLVSFFLLTPDAGFMGCEYVVQEAPRFLQANVPDLFELVQNLATHMCLTHPRAVPAVAMVSTSRSWNLVVERVFTRLPDPPEQSS